MKKFTRFWQLMMVLFLTSSVAFAQNAVTVQDALKNKTSKEEVLNQKQVNQDLIQQKLIEKKKIEQKMGKAEFIEAGYTYESLFPGGQSALRAPSNISVKPQKQEILTEGNTSWGVGLQGTGLATWDVDVPGTMNAILPGGSYTPFAGSYSNKSSNYIYIVDWNDLALKMVDVTTGAVAQVIGYPALGGGNPSGMALDRATGVMYLMVLGADDLYTIDLETAVITYIGSSGVAASMIEIAIDNSGQMYGWGLNDNAYTIDKATGIATLIGPLGVDINYAQGGGCDPATDIIYLAAYVASGQEMTLDKVTGAATLVGAFPGGEEVDAMTFPSLTPGTITNDMVLTSVDSPLNGGNGAAETVSITVFNAGSVAQSNIPVSFDFESGTTTANEVIVGPVAPGAFAVHTFAVTVNAMVNANYNIVACVSLVGDEVTSNDCLSYDFFTLNCVPVTSYPYLQNFDGLANATAGCTDGTVDLSPICWENWVDVSEGSDWDIDDSGTGSSNTGPSDDITGGGKYLFTETSGCNGYNATLVSPEFDLSSLTTPEVSFWYHMYGATMGTMTAEYTIDGGTTWVPFWTLTGDQGNTWFNQANPLAVLIGETSVYFRIVGLLGSSFTSDMAFDEFKVDEAPTCASPTAFSVTAVGTTTADLQWDEVGSATTWNFAWGVPGFDPDVNPDGTDSYSNSFGGNPYSYQILGLTDGTDYEVYVQAECGPGDVSPWTGAVAFTTPCAPFAVFPYNEGFESFPYACWTNNGWEDHPTWGAPHSGIGFAWGGYIGTTLTSPGLTLPAVTPHTMEYWFRVESASYPKSMDVLLSTDGVTFGTTLESIVLSTSTTYALYSYDLSAYAGQTIYIQFVVVDANDFWGVNVDDFAVFETPACPDPIGLTAANITASSADLSWTSNSGLSDLEWGLAGFTQGTGTMVTGIVTGTHSLTSLAEGTGYDWYVMDDCSGSVSGWVGPGTFTTLYTPPANDECVNAEAVAGPYPINVTGTTNGATVDCAGVLDWDAVWYAIDLPFAYNYVELDLCLDDVGAVLTNTGIILTADCSCDPASFIFSTGAYVVGANCISDLNFFVAGPTTVYYPVMTDPKGDFNFDVNVTERFQVTGTLTYANGASTPMELTTVTVDDGSKAVVGTTMTDLSGNFQFDWLAAGTYTLGGEELVKPRGGTDVSDVNELIFHILGTPLTGLEFLAGDIDVSGVIDVTDVNGLIFDILGSPGWAAPNFVFENPSVVLATKAVQDFQTLCSGDPDGSFTPAPAPAGAVCGNAVDLSLETSPYLGTTVGMGANFTVCGITGSQDWICYFDVLDGYEFEIGQTANDFDSRHTLRYGGACPGDIELACTDDPDLETISWINTSGSTQRVWFIIGGYSSSSMGTFTLEWNHFLWVPAYCDASTTSQDEIIGNVLCGTINNPSAWQGGVADYTAISTSIPAGGSEAITVTNIGGTWSGDNITVWVDWGADYVFDLGGDEEFLLTDDGAHVNYTGNIVVPAGTPPGTYRMRIRMWYSSSPGPCGSASYGEVEDYSIVVP